MVNYQTGKLSVDYPIYGSKFLNENTLLITGGGGEGNNGIPNKITALTIDFNRTKVIKRFRELPLPDDEDAPTCLDANNNIIIFSCNQSTNSIKSGNNKHVKKFGYINDHLRFLQDAQVNDTNDSTEYTKSVSLSEDGSVACLSSSQNGEIFIVDTDTLEVKFNIDTKTTVKDLCISSDGKILAYLTQSSVEFISTVTGNQIASQSFPDVSVSKIKFINNDSVIIASSLKKTQGLVLIEYSLGKKTTIRQKIINKKTRGVTSMAVGNGLIALGGNDTSIILLKASNFSTLKQFPKVHSFAITTVQLSPNGEYLASTSADNSINVFKLPQNLATSSSFLMSLFTKIFTFFLVVLLGIVIQWLIKKRVINDLVDYYKRELDSSDYFTIQQPDKKSSLLSTSFSSEPTLISTDPIYTSISSAIEAEEIDEPVHATSIGSTTEEIVSTSLTSLTPLLTTLSETSETSSTVSSSSSSTVRSTKAKKTNGKKKLKTSRSTNQFTSSALKKISSVIDSLLLTVSPSTEVITPGPSSSVLKPLSSSKDSSSSQSLSQSLRSSSSVSSTSASSSTASTSSESSSAVSSSAVSSSTVSSSAVSSSTVSSSAVSSSTVSSSTVSSSTVSSSTVSSSTVSSSTVSSSIVSSSSVQSSPVSSSSAPSSSELSSSVPSSTASGSSTVEVASLSSNATPLSTERVTSTIEEEVDDQEEEITEEPSTSTIEIVETVTSIEEETTTEPVSSAETTVEEIIKEEPIAPAIETTSEEIETTAEEAIVTETSVLAQPSPATSEVEIEDEVDEQEEITEAEHEEEESEENVKEPEEESEEEVVEEIPEEEESEVEEATEEEEEEKPEEEEVTEEEEEADEEVSEEKDDDEVSEEVEDVPVEEEEEVLDEEDKEEEEENPLDDEELIIKDEL